MTSGTVTAKVFRYDPDADIYPTYKTYEIPCEEKMMVLQILKEIYEKQDRTLAFRYYSCAFKLCNGCMMMINGQAKHACMTVVKPGDTFTVEPMTGYPIIRDLVVDFGKKVRTPDGTFNIYRGRMLKKNS